jgi:protein-disulfide isomerase
LGKHKDKIDNDVRNANAIGINGTPSFVIGRTVSGASTIYVEAFFAGVRPFAEFKAELDKLLDGTR